MREIKGNKHLKKKKYWGEKDPLPISLNRLLFTLNSRQSNIIKKLLKHSTMLWWIKKGLLKSTKRLRRGSSRISASLSIKGKVVPSLSLQKDKAKIRGKPDRERPNSSRKQWEESQASKVREPKEAALALHPLLKSSLEGEIARVTSLQRLMGWFSRKSIISMMPVRRRRK